VKIKNDSSNIISKGELENIKNSRIGIGIESIDTILKEFNVIAIDKHSNDTLLIRFPISVDLESVKSKLEENGHIAAVSYNFFRGLLK
jgi:hypothetical protein